MRRSMIITAFAAATVGVSLYQLVRRLDARWEREERLLRQVREVAARCPDVVEPLESVELRGAEMPSETITVSSKPEPKRRGGRPATKQPEVLTCEGCGVTFEKIVYPSRPARFCSKACASRTHGTEGTAKRRVSPGTKRPQSFTCETCGAAFERMTNPSQPTPRFCSRACQGKVTVLAARAGRAAKRAEQKAAQAQEPEHIAIPQLGDTVPAATATADEVATCPPHFWTVDRYGLHTCSKCSAAKQVDQWNERGRNWQQKSADYRAAKLAREEAVRCSGQ